MYCLSFASHCLSSSSRLAQVFSHGESKGSREREWKFTRLLEANLRNCHTVTSAMFYWPKQFTKHTQIQGSRNRLHLLKGEAAKSHWKSIDSERSGEYGEICNQSAILTPFLIWPFKNGKSGHLYLISVLQSKDINISPTGKFLYSLKKITFITLRTFLFIPNLWRVFVMKIYGAYQIGDFSTSILFMIWFSFLLYVELITLLKLLNIKSLSPSALIFYCCHRLSSWNNTNYYLALL